MSQRILVYGSPLCAMVGPVRNLLDRARAEYDYIDISRDPQGRATVSEINHGNASVPTIIFPDQSTLTEPSLAELQTKLEGLGHTVRPRTWRDQARLFLDSPTIRIVALVSVGIGLVNGDMTLTTIGAVFLAAGFASRFLPSAD